MLASATSASAAPHSAPNGNSVRPAMRMLFGRTKPARPTAPHADSSNRHSIKGELRSKITRAPAKPGVTAGRAQGNRKHWRSWVFHYNSMHITADAAHWVAYAI